METRGILALDIDGTLTGSDHVIPREVASYLGGLHEKGFVIYLITGRPFSFAKMSLDYLHFPYFLSLQNGADILKMPSMERVAKFYFDRSVALHIEELYMHQKEDFLVYAGTDRGDFCFYRPARYKAEMLTYLEKLKKLSKESWQAVTSFSELQQEEFPLIKCFGEIDFLQNLEKKLRSVGLETSIIDDPVSGYLSIILVTASGVTKGHAIDRIKELLQIDTPVIAAGNDYNDIPMLKEADVKIVMQDAPKKMLEMADIIAPPSTEMGIILALKEALQKWKI